MKINALTSLCLIILSLGTSLWARTDDDVLFAAIRAADDERIAATMAGDPVRLAAIFSDQLYYAHSNGKVDDKNSYVQSLTSRKTIYESFDYQTRNFAVTRPGVVLMTGRVVVHVISGDQKIVADLNFLSVWREEGGRWRFLAWQSCMTPPAERK